MSSRCRRAVDAALLAAAACNAASALAEPRCEHPRILAPALHQTIGEARPVIRWAAVPGSSTFRVILNARKPEGGVLASIDTWVYATEFIPPAVLAVTTAR